MPVRCTVCSSSFKGSSALQMHKDAKCHNQSDAGDASGENTSRDQPQAKSNPSNTRPSTAGQVRSSGGLKFRCNSCNRSFKSREALGAHAEAKGHPVTTTAKVKRPGKPLFRCDVCGRGDFGSHNALNDHKRDSKDHQTRNQHSAPPIMPSNLGTRTDYGLPRINDAFTLTVNRMVQRDQCSYNSPGNCTYESYLAAPSWEGQKQQNMPLSNAGNNHPLALGYRYDGGNDASCHFWETCTGSEEYAIDASQQFDLAKESDSGGVPTATSSALIGQPAITEDLLKKNTPYLQLSSKLANLPGSVRPKPLEHLGKEWSTVLPSEQPFALKVLRDLCHSVSDLEENGYRLREYTSSDLMGRQKCKACKRQQKDIRRHEIPCKANLRKDPRLLQNNGPQAQPYDVSKQPDQANDVLPSHTFPKIGGRKQNRYLKSTWTPKKDPQRPKCPAVTLDCEMVDVVGDGDLWREVVKVSVVDFLSGETLLNTLVLPTAKVKRWKTEITGITEQMMTEARVHGNTVKGWTGARSELWRHINADTVLVGQSLHYDLEVLGMLHTRVVDSAILAAKAIDLPGTKTFGLKKMCKEMLNVDIQCLDGAIHDCLEDALASRELVLYSIYNPEGWQTWALSKRQEELEKKAGSQRQRKGRTETASHQDKWQGKGLVTDVGDDVSNLFDNDEDSEVLRWDDIAEDLGWPHPDTGYDPWSD